MTDPGLRFYEIKINNSSCKGLNVVRGFGFTKFGLMLGCQDFFLTRSYANSIG